MVRQTSQSGILHLICLLVLLTCPATALTAPAGTLAAQFEGQGSIEITPELAGQYDLFDNIEFLSAQILPPPEGTKRYLLIWTESRDGEAVETTLPLGKGVRAAMHRHAVQRDATALGFRMDSLWCEIELADGSNIFGQYLAWDGPNLICLTQLGKLTFPLTAVTGFDFISQASGTQLGRILRADPNPTRLLFAPTARNLQKGKGYFSVYEVIMPSVQYGFGGNVSLGGGLSPIISDEFAMFWLTPKVGLVEKEDYALALGLLSINMIAPGDDGGSIGIGYGVATWGKPDKALTAGFGWGYSSVDSGAVSSEPFFMLGGELRIGRNTKLITENWLPPGWNSPLFSVGLRWFSKRISADFALIHQPDMGDVLAIPWIDFIVNF